MLLLCNGMLRSGSTLQYNLGARVLEAAGAGAREGFFGNFARSDVQDRLRWLRDDQKWHVVKTHEYPLAPEFYDERVKVLFSYRGMLDIAASIRKAWNHDFPQILDELDSMLELDNKIRALPHVLSQPYDLLYGDLREAVRQIAEFLGIALSPAQIEAIARENSVENMRGLIETRRNGRLLSIVSHLIPRLRIDRTTQLHHNHISPTLGADGDWARLFSESEISELKLRESRLLARRGSPPDPSGGPSVGLPNASACG